jgi:hypothetical protein
METASLVFEEALPSPVDFPRDAAMSRRGLELLIDSFALRNPAGDPPAELSIHDRE